MGAWGEGMQANDTALDYIGKYQNFEAKEGIPLNEFGREVVDGKRPILGELKEIEEDQGILGVAEFFLDKGVDLKPARTLILKAIRNQLSKDEIGSWRSMGARRDALQRFKSRVMGKKVDPEKVSADNKGLFEKMAEHMKEDGK